MENEFNFSVEVFANSGSLFSFYPLYIDSEGANNEKELINEVASSKAIGWCGLENFAERNDQLRKNQGLCNFLTSTGCRDWGEGIDAQGERCQFLRFRFTRKVFATAKSGEREVFGLEIAVETATSGNEDHDRQSGFLHSKVDFDEDDERRNAPQPPSVYHRMGDNEVLKFKIKQDYPSLDQDEQEACFVLFNVDIKFKKPDAIRKLNADLVIDVGNTRTVAVLVKEDETGKNRVESIRTRCRPVMLCLDTRSRAITPKESIDIGNSVVSSWFVLHETEFSDFEKENADNRLPLLYQPSYETVEIRRFLRRSKVVNVREIRRIPNMFVRSSPVVLGDAAKRFMLDSHVVSMIENGRRLQQSSPKRYFADQRRIEIAFWKMVPNDPNGPDPELAANVLYWMNEDGEFINRDAVPAEKRPARAPLQAVYPRSSTLVWMLVAILERAWEQCNQDSCSLTRYLPYILKNVVITYPAGWTCDEIALYRTRCQQAVEIFERSTFGTAGQILVNMRVDEAVASQMPYVFSEIHRLKDNAAGWLKVAGKVRDGGRGASARIMNFDIGGGTSDISIVEYACQHKEGDDVVLTPRLLFRDGFAKAGDDLMKSIITDVVFKSFDESGQVDSNGAGYGELVRRCFTGRSEQLEEEPTRSLYVKQCLVPLAIQIMGDVSSLSPTGVVRSEDVPAGIEPNVWADFGRYVLRLSADSEVPDAWKRILLKYDADDVSAVIHSDTMFGRSFQECAKLAAKFDIDAFFMSGKTSELPELKRMANEYIPLSPNRIVTARDYNAGQWYPFADEKHRISDAKSVTSVGAALHHMLSAGVIKGWKMAPIGLSLSCVKGSQWGIFEDLQNGDPAFAFNSDNRVTLKIRSGTQIGKKLRFSDREEPVYRFVNVLNKNDDQIHQVVLSRYNDGNSEGLKIESVDGGKVDVTVYRLLVDQMNETELGFWQDTGNLL